MSDLFKGIPGGAFGNSIVGVIPAQASGVAPFGWGEIKTVVKFPGQLRKGNAAQEMDSAIITASVYAEPLPPASRIGPLTGLALWGSGGSATNVAEFDIPIGTSFDPDSDITDPAPFDTPRGGTIISVVGTSLEIRARNDANLLPAGPGGNGANQLPIGGTATTAPALVSAALGKGPRATEFAATKTVWAVNGNAGGGLAPAASVFVRIPPFAKSFRIVRSGGVAVTSAAIQFAIFGNTVGNSDGTYTVATGVLAPEVKLSGGQTTLIINNTDTGTIFQLYVIFFLAI